MPEYALILLLLLLVTVFLHYRFKITIFKSKYHLFIFYAVIFIVGILWDHFAIGRGHWIFGREFILGQYIGLIPIEEYLFVIIVFYFSLVIYKITEKYTKK